MGVSGPSREELQLSWGWVAHWLGEGEAPPERAPAPAPLAALAYRHRLEAALAEPALTRGSPEGHVPPALWSRWQKARGAALAQLVWRAEPLRAALAALSPIPAIVFKGAATAELIYPTPAARPMVDVDLLVRAEDAPEAVRRLGEIGYRCYHWGHPFFHRRYYHEWPLLGPEIEIDLHRGFSQASRVPADYGAIFDRSLAWPELGPNARLLSPEDAVACQALQPGRSEFSVSGAPFIGVLDLKLMLMRAGPFWAQAGGPPLEPSLVALRAAEWGAERSIYAGLAVAARLLPSLAGRVALAQPALPAPLRRLIDRLVVEPSARPTLEDPARREVWLRKAILTPSGAFLTLPRERIAGLCTVARRRLRAPRPLAPRPATPLAKRLFG